jgi:RNA polymerase sigma factor (sigma-70 family)
VLSRSSSPAPWLGQGPTGRSLAELVVAARDGDAGAWECLVRRLDGVVRGTARSFRLQPADVEDVAQATWLDLLEHIDAIREPARTAAWLVTVTRRAALATARARGRAHEQLCEDPGDAPAAASECPETMALDAERRAGLAGALARLSDRQRTIVTLLLTQPVSDYRLVSALANVPIGSIGPTRARALERLSLDPALRALHDIELAA